jgi:two-component system response regulator HydG
MTERVLIVDDEEDLRYVYTRQLRGDGYLLDTAVDGEEAIEKIRTNEYAVILTDMRMPRKDGLAVIAAAREHLPDAEIIVLTGHGSLENALQAFKSGNIFEYLLKPLDDIGVLNTVVARAMERRNLRKHNRELFEQLQRAYEELRQKSEMLIQNEKMIWANAGIDRWFYCSASLCFLQDTPKPAENKPMTRFARQFVDG